jgi:hypothetical protein
LGCFRPDANGPYLAQALISGKGKWTMKAGVVYPQIELGGDTGAVKAFAQAADDLGTITSSAPFMPEENRS